MAKARAAGRLDGLRVLEAEKKLITDKQPVPATDDAGTSAALKNLRTIYREAYAKLEAARTTNSRALTDPLVLRLKNLESDLAKQNRIADAKVVREYREKLPAPESKVTGSLTHPFINTLGMKFVPVPGTKVLMCIHETRRQDYAAYAADVPGGSDAWKTQQRDGIACGAQDNHPVCGVSCEDAQKYCEWLGRKEGRIYRLPTDEEWSSAVGLGGLEKYSDGVTPETLSGRLTTQFPWGGDYPPKTQERAGNYRDTAWLKQWPAEPGIDNYTDGFATTAPVMSFKPNKLGIYDLGGNVWEWVETWWNATQQERVVRGASFYTGGHDNLLSSFRFHLPPTHRDYYHGFRCVVEPSSPKGGSVPAAAVTPPAAASPPTPPASTAQSPPIQATKDQPFANTLGMKFVPVPATEVLFCIHTTRVKDYAAYAKETPGVNSEWKSQQQDGIPVSSKGDDPVVGVSWDDAKAFCSWLSQKEKRAYRLPTDREWSIAVGLGQQEAITANTTPESLNSKISDLYPWGVQWPPPNGAGNYPDTSFKSKFPALETIAGYTDGFPTTSPVMSFKPNSLGLYDMGGNVWQWCEDWYNASQTTRVTRGGSWFHAEHVLFLSSFRSRNASPGTRRNFNGFRCVVEQAALSAKNTQTPNAPAPAGSGAAATPPSPNPPGASAGTGASAVCSGRITDEDGRPVYNAEVHISAGYVKKSVTTDMQGRYTMTVESPGSVRSVSVVPPRDSLLDNNYKTVSIKPSTAVQLDFILFQHRTVAIDYLYQPDDSHDFAGNVSRGTIVMRTGSSFGAAVFHQGKAEQKGQPNDITVEVVADRLSFRCFYKSSKGNGFIDLGEVAFDGVTQAPETGYSMSERPCLVGHVYVVRTYDGKYAKFAVKKIAKSYAVNR
jgi:formylglycine-generating enzyme required for sulfatase activity